MIDEIDKTLLELLQQNAKLSNADLAQAVGLTISSVHERVKKLEQRGIITGYVATVDPTKLGKPLLAFFRLTLGPNQPEGTDAAVDTLQALSTSDPDILECHQVAGEDCIMMKIRCTGTHDLPRILSKVRNSVESSRSVTSIVLSTLKESIAVTPVLPDEAG